MQIQFFLFCAVLSNTLHFLNLKKRLFGTGRSFCVMQTKHLIRAVQRIYMKAFVQDKKYFKCKTRKISSFWSSNCPSIFRRNVLAFGRTATSKRKKKRKKPIEKVLVVSRLLRLTKFSALLVSRKFSCGTNSFTVIRSMSLISSAL